MVTIMRMLERILIIAVSGLASIIGIIMRAAAKCSFLRSIQEAMAKSDSTVTYWGYSYGENKYSPQAKVTTGQMRIDPLASVSVSPILY